jgi:RND family efflux transporter MFP subunit
MDNKRDGGKSVTLKLMKWAAGVTGLVVMILYTGGVFHTKTASGKIAIQPGQPFPGNGETFQVRIEEVAPRIDIVGTVASEEKVHLSARISTYVKDVFVSAGDTVEQGQSLIQLDDREIREQMAGANVRLKQAKTEYQRTRTLFEKKASTEQALTASESMYQSARTQVDRVKIMLSYADIKSPINGMVTDRRVEIGDLANPGQVLLSVYDPENMRIEVPVPVRLIERLSLGQEVEIELDRPTRPFRGRVAEIVMEVDPLSRTQKVKVHIDDPNGDVLPGTFGRIWVADDPHKAVLVPRQSVYRVGQLEIVQIIQQERVIRRMVKTGPLYGDRIEILSGLRDGDEILMIPVKGD